MPGDTQTIDYDALAKQHGATTGSDIDYDALAQEHGAIHTTGDKGSPWQEMDPKALQQQIESNPFRALQVPFEQLGATAGRAHDQLADKMLEDAAKGRGVSKTDYVKHFLLGASEDSSKIIAGATSPTGLAVAGATALVPEIMGPALMLHGGVNAAANIPEAIKGDPDAVQRFLESSAEAASGGIATRGAFGAGATSPVRSAWQRYSPARSVEEALGRKLTPQELITPRPGGANLPALNNTPQEVLTYAKKIGVNLTPGQATEDAMAQNLQKAGTTAAIGGKDLQAALLENQSKFAKAVTDFRDTVDPHKQGVSTDQAGQTVQRTVKVARDVAHDNASQNYDAIGGLMDEPVDPSRVSTAWNKLKGDLPMGAEEGILAQTPRSMRAVVEDLLSGNPEGFKPTVGQAIQLRKFFRDLGTTEGLPDRTQATYSKMENAMDSALKDSAAKNNFSKQWDDANKGWRDYKTKYGDPKSTLFKITNARNPEQIISTLQNAAPSDIAMIRNETAVKNPQGQIVGDGLDPLRRQIVKDIQGSRYRIGGDDGLGGYSHEYLNQLFKPDQLKELYVQSDLAHRLHYDPNPSGTGANISSVSQLGAWNQAKMSAAAKLSMPKDALSYIGSGATKTSVPIAPAYKSLTSPVTGVRALIGAGGASQIAEEGR